ncbi:MAG: exonuclease SbcCD subunit D [Candidatus Woesearchaeota archaeon]
MRFIHFADCHLDGYREEKLSRLGFENFTKVIDAALENEVDFVLLAGDLFNTALPRVDVLKETVEQLRRLYEQDIPVYTVPGSHDFSPRGRTMLDVLEKAELITNVVKGSVSEKGKLQLKLTRDEKTGTLITGLLGKKGMLDKHYYEDLDREHLKREIDGGAGAMTIFMFHTAISELKPKDLEHMQAAPISFMPEGFDYYAGGHVHITSRYSTTTYPNVVYPGPTFPNNFAELEKLGSGTYVYYDSEAEFTDGNGTTTHFKHVKLDGRPVLPLTIDLSGTAYEAVSIMLKELEKHDVEKKIVLLRLHGTLAEGKVSEIEFNDVLKHCYDNGAFIVLKNTNKLSSKMFEEVVVNEDSTDSIEETTIDEHLGTIKLPEGYDEKETVDTLMMVLDQEQLDGEKKSTFVERIKQETKDAIEQKKEGTRQGFPE